MEACIKFNVSRVLADVGNKPSIVSVLDDAREIVEIFGRDICPNTLLKEQQQQRKVKRDLAMDCATRFSSKHDMLESVLANKEALKDTVLLESSHKMRRGMSFAVAVGNLLCTHLISS